MDPILRSRLIEEAHVNAYAYLRNLVAAEAAIQRGQFNVAKLLRATAHAHRILGMQAARQGADEPSATVLFETNLAELDPGLDPDTVGNSAKQDPLDTALRQSTQVRAQMRNLILRAVQSLEAHPDVMESDVAQSLWGCFSCGYVAQGARPEVCPVCGALGVEFQLFGPFYSATPEHLGQLRPADIVSTLAAVAGELTALVTPIEDNTLSRKPSEAEWSVKETLGHMLETDALFVRRVRTILEAQGIPDIRTAVPPWKLHEGKAYDAMPVQELLERFGETRSVSLALVQALTPEQWARQGSNGGTGTSVLDLGTWLARDDQGHTAQIRRLLESWS